MKAVFGLRDKLTDMKNRGNLFIAATKVINEKFLSPWRWKLLVKRLTANIGDSKTILDIGAGDGGLASEILKICKVKITGIDPHPQEVSFIPVTKFDGVTIPFANKSFDMSMINDVLHHDHHPEQILSEAKRVSKKYILIKDHYWTNKVDFALLKWTDGFGNLSYGVNLPYNFLTIESWKKMFKTLDLKIVKMEKFRYSLLDPSLHVIFLLAKNDN